MIVQSGAQSARRSRLLGAAFPPFSKPLLRLVTAASLAGLAATPALAGSLLPTGGTVASGNVTISTPTNNSLTVTQTTSKAIVNWQGFSIGSANTVTFDNGSGATLNRVTGSQQSNIDGTLNATGSVYLLNPNGVVIGQSGIVNVGKNFVASTLGASDAQFNASGPLTLNGNSQAAVVNLGKIGSLGGDVALVAQQALNAGTISAPNGSAGVLAGSQVTLRDSTLDDGKFNVDVGNSTNQAVNKGNIAAAEAELKANGGNVYALAGNTSGVIAATGVARNDGKVFLTAGDAGTVTANTEVSAQTSTGAGGTVETSGGKVNFTGIRVHAGNWIIDPPDLAVTPTDAATIETNLATTDVTLKTTATSTSGPGTVNPSGNGDIIVAAPISWSSSHSLTLSAYENVLLLSDITSSGGGNITLRADNTGTGTGVVVPGATISTSGAVDIFFNTADYHTSINYSAYVTGGATLNAYMLVNTAANLQAIGTDATTLSGTYALGKDIDLTGVAFTPLGDFSNPFSGVLDGQGHTISNLDISEPLGTLYTGLFSVLQGTARNFTLDNSTIVAGNITGGIAGIDSGLIDNVTVTASVTVKGGGDVGGLVGQLSGGTISNSRSAASVMDIGNSGADGGFGGVVGQNTGTVIDTSSSATVTGGANSRWVGGVVGTNDGAMTNDSSTATLIAGTGTESVGGLAGNNISPSGVITNSSADVTIDLGPTSILYVGGLVGSNTGQIINSSVTGSVAVEQASDLYVGGLVGLNGTGGQITDSTATAAVSGITDVGGLVGWNKGTISGSNAGGCGCTGSATGITNTGGLVGLNSGVIENSTATLPVFGTATIDFPVAGATGGLVGFNDASGHITESSASGAVDADRIVGGLAGSNAGAIDNSTSSSIVTSEGDSTNTGDDVGGLVGTNQLGGTVTLSIASGNAIGAHNGTNVGGLVGLNQGTILDAGSTAGASGDLVTGGLVGLNDTTGLIAGSWATGGVSPSGTALLTATAGGLVGENKNVITTSWSSGRLLTATEPMVAGGLVGQNDSGAEITYAYAIGEVSGKDGSVGGLIGINKGLADNVYATGHVILSGSGTAAGLVADNSAGTLSNAYWDTATTNQASAVGVSGSETNVGSVSASDNSAFAETSYTNFDFTAGTGYWFMIDGQTRPFLQAEAWSIGSSRYLITNSHQLQLIAMAPNATYTLTGSDANVDAVDTELGGVGDPSNMWTSAGFVPIASFGGTFDGQGGAVENLFISRNTTNDVGLFATIAASGKVTNLALTQVNITGADDVGALAGQNFGKIYGSYSDGGTPFAAGVTGANEVGGLVGSNESGGVIDQIASGPLGVPVLSQSFVNVSGSGDDVGGLVGNNQLGGSISNAMAGGTVQGFDDVGGLVGTSNALITRSFANGGVTAFNSNAGGLAGQLINGATVTDSYATGAVNAPTNAGGLVGRAMTTTEIDRSYASGDVSGTTDIGGLVGYLFKADVDDVYALGAVTGDPGSDSVGGLIGYADRVDISYGYAAGAVSGTSNVNGLVGNPADILSATGLYWDEDTTGQAASGLASGATPVGINSTGLDAYSSANYANLNDGNWLFVDGVAGGEGARPMLAMEYSTVVTNAHQLELIATAPNAAYVLGADVDASGTATGADVWSAEGLVPTQFFGGTLEGNGHSILGLTENRPTTNVGQGLFSVIQQGATVEDVAIVDPSITGANFVGGIAGSSYGTVVNDVVAGGTLQGNNYVGGLVGANHAGAVLGGVFPSSVPGFGIDGANLVEATQIYGVNRVGGLAGWNAGTIGSGSTTNPELMSLSSAAIVSGSNQVGGIVGWNDGSIDSVIGSNADVEGSGYGIGGLVGYNTVSASLTNSQVTATFFGPPTVGASGGNGIGGAVGQNAGLVSKVQVVDTSIGNAASSTVGGIVGNNVASGLVSDSFIDSSNTVTGAKYVGGLVGTNSGEVTQGSESDASVSGTSYVGGAAGQNLAGATLADITATGAVIASGNDAGGLVGFNAGTITGATATGSVSGANSTGGLAGLNQGAITLSSASGTVGGASDVGGLVGLNKGSIDTSSVTLTDVEGSGYAIGGLVGFNSATGTLSNSTVTGTGSATIGTTGGGIGGAVGDNAGHADDDQVVGLVIGNSTQTTVGGYVGKNENNASISGGTVDSSSSVTGLNFVGGFAGTNAGAIDTSKSDAGVIGASYVGGFAGSNAATGTLTSDTATGLTDGTGARIGGLVGWNASGGQVINGLASGQVVGFDQTGGLVGWNDGSILGSAASGETTGSDYAVGGLVGYNTTGATIDDSSATGIVDGTASVLGGLVGYNKGSVTNAFASGSVGIASTHIAGGLIGYNLGSLSEVYASGPVQGAATVGALVGFNGATGTLTNAYWDKLDTGLTKAFGANLHSGATAVGLAGSHPPTAQASYVGFDFVNHWTIQPGQLPTLTNHP